MNLGSDDIRRVHEFFGGPDDLIAQRRAVYAVAAQLLVQDESSEPNEMVLDNPLVRGHVAEVLSGVTSFSDAELLPLSDLVANGYLISFGGGEVRLASSKNV